MPSVNAQSLDPQITAKSLTLKQKQRVFIASQGRSLAATISSRSRAEETPKRWGRGVLIVAKQEGEGNSKLGIATNLELTQILTRVILTELPCV